MDRHELAWAAGFFDGEGWANRAERGVQSRINQAGADGMPEVLVKFQRIVGVGRLKGPTLIEGRKPLYHWEATSRPDLQRVAGLISPWLCDVKRRQFEHALGTPLSPRAWPGSMSEELAWASGFFDGEGSTYLLKHRTRPNYFAPVLDIPQASRHGIAGEPTRFKVAVGGRGSISGPRRDKRRRKPYHRWRAGAQKDVALILHLLWPFIGAVKRILAKSVTEIVNTQPELPRGNPAFGVPGARVCLRGHDKWSVRVRPFRSRERTERIAISGSAWLAHATTPAPEGGSDAPSTRVSFGQLAGYLPRRSSARYLLK